MVTVEENAVSGGAGSAINEILAAHGVVVPVLNLGIPDRFIEHGSREDCLTSAGLDMSSVENAINRWWATSKGSWRLTRVASFISQTPIRSVAPESVPVYIQEFFMSTPDIATSDTVRIETKGKLIEDVQGRADTRQLPIDKVGIKDIFHPVRVKDRSGGEQHTVANFNMSVALPPLLKARICRASWKCCSERGEISSNRYGDILRDDAPIGCESGRMTCAFRTSS